MVRAQSAFNEDFTGATTSNQWYFYTGACLTAGSSAVTTTPNIIPSCTTVKTTYYGENLVGGQNGIAGSAQTLPDTVGNGALRLTNGYITGSTGGYNQNGAIVSAGDPFDAGAGVQITFKTVTYRGNSGGAGGDGADGISFFLMDGATNLSTYSGVGAFGGSLGYTCSNTNNDPTLRPDGTPRGYDGLVGAYIGLGIDEYGNFLNPGDNTASGPGYVPGRIGLRGRGNISWKWLNATYPALYPNSLSTANRALAVQAACRLGTLSNGTAVPDYAALTDGAGNSASVVLPGSVKIANEYATGGFARGNATPILYKLKITQDGLLSLAYSYNNGGVFSPVITNQSITAANGNLPATLRFGFAGSSGGSTNIHEIMCFKASPATQAGTSASGNEKQAAKVDNGTLAFFAYYDPNTWTGRLTANFLIDTAGVVTVDSPKWDASCGLTGLAGPMAPNPAETCADGRTGPLAAQTPTNRVMLTSRISGSSSNGRPFRWASLTAAQQTALGASSRLDYLRGDRTNEINNLGVGLYRARDSILSDIVDSSPAFVGPPTSPYTSPWLDRITGASGSETAGSYAAFTSTNQTRVNVVYSGANDGFLHGFRTGSFLANGQFNIAASNGSPSNNDGTELLAYMPGAVLSSIHNTSDATLDFSSTQYGHNFYVDAPPATGDLYYGNAWHTWLVGGLGPGGKAIYALDVTDPSAFTEANASTLVMGEWTPSNLTCAPACGTNLGNTYGTPQIRRLHNGTWAIIFGNGYGSTSGDAGIFIITINNAGTKSYYYLSTGTAGTGNGIAYTAPADLDGDHITDFVYAGDLNGNLWRFDLTSNTAANWGTNTTKLFAGGASQPITTKPVIASVPVGGTSAARLMIAFGTGQRFPVTNSTPASYAAGAQDLYGVWDWNLGSWNSVSTTQYQSLTAAATGLTGPGYVIGKANLQQQTVTVTGGNRDGSSTAICWKAPATCGASSTKFGWYIDLPGSSEQIVYSPLLFQGAFIVDSTVPANNSALSCTQSLDTGYTYIVKVDSGSKFAGAFVGNPDTNAIGVQTDATGTPYVVTTVEGTTSLVFQTISGSPTAIQVSLPSNLAGQRLTWIELR
jgi:type IV pilus assembly protein PilY1